jgi:hypothetical protein
MAASVVKSCDLDHKPNHSGPGFITAPPSPHDSAAGCERAIFPALASAVWRCRLDLAGIGLRRSLPPFPEPQTGRKPFRAWSRCAFVSPESSAGSMAMDDPSRRRCAELGLYPQAAVCAFYACTPCIAGALFNSGNALPERSDLDHAAMQ